ncbi:hypothetical protein DYB25_005138, partial [Aphanomyces astaci]
MADTEGTHPLHTAWSIWELREMSKGNYADKLHKLCTFKTVEDFWGYWNNLPKPSQVLNDGVTKKKLGDRAIESFCFFREGITPEWEDPINLSGGEWQLQAEELDHLWDKLVLGMIGETIDPDNEITGARIIHKNKKDQHSYRFELWLRSRDINLADVIRNDMLDCLNTDNKGKAITRADCVHKTHNALELRVQCTIKGELRSSGSGKRGNAKSKNADGYIWRQDSGVIKWYLTTKELKALKSKAPTLKLYVFGIGDEVHSLGWFFMDLRTPDTALRWIKLVNSKYSGEIHVSSQLRKAPSFPSIPPPPPQQHDLPVVPPTTTGEDDCLDIRDHPDAIYVLSIVVEGATHMGPMVEALLKRCSPLELHAILAKGFWLSYSIFDVVVQTDVFHTLDVAGFDVIRDSFRLKSSLPALAALFTDMAVLPIFLCTVDRILCQVQASLDLVVESHLVYATTEESSAVASSKTAVLLSVAVDGHQVATADIPTHPIRVLSPVGNQPHVAILRNAQGVAVGEVGYECPTEPSRTDAAKLVRGGYSLQLDVVSIKATAAAAWPSDETVVYVQFPHPFYTGPTVHTVTLVSVGYDLVTSEGVLLSENTAEHDLTGLSNMRFDRLSSAHLQLPVMFHVLVKSSKSASTTDDPPICVGHALLSLQYLMHATLSYECDVCGDTMSDWTTHANHLDDVGGRTTTLYKPFTTCDVYVPVMEATPVAILHVRDAQQEYMGLEKKLRQTLHDLDVRERSLTKAEEALQHKLTVQKQEMDIVSRKSKSETQHAMSLVEQQKQSSDLIRQQMEDRA